MGPGPERQQLLQPVIQARLTGLGLGWRPLVVDCGLDLNSTSDLNFVWRRF